jgi:hypothetical protein
VNDNVVPHLDGFQVSGIGAFDLLRIPSQCDSLTFAVHCLYRDVGVGHGGDGSHDVDHSVVSEGYSRE